MRITKRIITNPKILAGKPVIAGTRIPVSLILNLLAHGQTTDEIIDDYPDLTPDDIKAAIKYAQELVENKGRVENGRAVVTS